MVGNFSSPGAAQEHPPLPRRFLLALQICRLRRIKYICRKEIGLFTWEEGGRRIRGCLRMRRGPVHSQGGGGHPQRGELRVPLSLMQLLGYHLVTHVDEHGRGRTPRRELAGRGRGGADGGPCVRASRAQATRRRAVRFEAQVPTRDEQNTWTKNCSRTRSDARKARARPSRSPDRGAS